MDCIFCKIANKEISSMCIYEDDFVLAFLDINPDCNGHTLIIPKKHYKDIHDIPENILLHIFNISKEIMKKLEKKINCDGFSLLQNNGDAQEVKHFHLHIKPFYNENKPNELIKHQEYIDETINIFKKIKEE